MIVDGNVHITDDGKWFSSTLDASLDALLNKMNDAGVDRALVVPLPGTISNEQALNACAMHPQQLMCAYTFNPALYEDEKQAANHYESEILSLPFSLVKFHNRFAKYQPDDLRFMSVLERNNQSPKPHVIMICGFLNDRHSSSYTDPVSYFFNLARKYDKTTFVIGHSAGPFLLQVAELCKDLSNVYFDISYSISRYRNSSLELDLKWMCEKLDRKIIWGSDFPEIEPKKALLDLKEITSTLSSEKFENSAGKNLLKILER